MLNPFKTRKINNLTREEAFRITQIEKDCNLSRWSIEDYQDEARRTDSIFLIAETEGNKINDTTQEAEDKKDEIVAFLVSRNILSSTVSPMESESDLLNFGVVPEHQNTGVGGRLFGLLLTELSTANIHSIWLEVRKTNENAVRFYLKRGFRVIQTRKNFYTGPSDDALVLKYDSSADTEKDTSRC